MIFGTEARWEGETPRPDYWEDAHAREFNRPAPQFDARRFAGKVRAALHL